MKRSPRLDNATRVKAFGEVLTPSWLVKEMLDKLPRECWQEDKTFLDNSCGTGNFLVPVLARKIQLGHNPLNALKSIYGAELLWDNTNITRARLLAVFPRVSAEHVATVLQNIHWVGEYPNGSLDYDFGFEQVPSFLEIKKFGVTWRDWVPA